MTSEDHSGELTVRKRNRTRSRKSCLPPRRCGISSVQTKQKVLNFRITACNQLAPLKLIFTAQEIRNSGKIVAESSDRKQNLHPFKYEEEEILLKSKRVTYFFQVEKCVLGKNHDSPSLQNIKKLIL
ncbi:hypothetical protein TNIN_343331 [Trichonephila inaurata madagascariensis]|uniref:Uncharacterized protein n=1 Tax=Trichonephila inaurata madagascariensis TaxID=2747483 RepID=A0A8X6XD80_9ARAC|nr:hypothetical protein TNIN_343331 [Trichonephila inaurata madagascariensis]